MTKVTPGSFKLVFDPSIGRQWWYINDHTFVQAQDGRWHMFGITAREPAKPDEEKFFAHAVSDSLTGSLWKAEPPVMHARPDCHEEHVWAPHVVFHEGRYLMFYCAGAGDQAVYRIHLATSTDLYNWERWEGNPILEDGYHGRDPMLFRHGDEWILYYTATSAPEGGNHIVAAVTSRDLVSWSERRVVFTHPKVGTWGGPTESPFVVRRRGKFYLFICRNRPYNSTTVYESDNPFEWSIENEVGLIPAHAAEVIELPGDQWLISRCGWNQGGLYLAPLNWIG